MDRSTVANSLRLLKLPAEVQEMVERGELSAGHGRALLAFAGEKECCEWARRVVATGLSVRGLEAAAADAGEGGEARRRRSAVDRRGARDPNLLAAEEKLALRLGAPVEIRTRRRGGTIVIACSDQSELMRVFDLLMGGE
jgi:ParB family chromosome partitioning protein